MNDHIAPEIAAYYTRGEEDGRLRTGRNRLEFWRTQDVLRRHLPPPPARILDIGGGSGVHAEWLAADGYQVELVDPVPLHVRQAAAIPGVTAREGDARDLGAEPGAYDVALLLGPLYHLRDRADRVRALAEAARAVRPGGVVAAATISRFAALHDMVKKGQYARPEIRAIVLGAAGDGGFDGRPDMGFTTAYFHDADEIVGEFEAAGLPGARRFGVEGAFWLMDDVNAWLDEPEMRRLLLDALRRVELEPTLLGVSGHLVTIASRSGQVGEAGTPGA
ncbi:class I SAM-dependent methyltransferase [Streptosporangium sp. KLBMP 9127]|nr:class I SAM-dependent methyltransferase [Streptosporangium sp. KLBMP 9127]